MLLPASHCIRATEKYNTYLPGLSKCGGQARTTFRPTWKKLVSGIVQFELERILGWLEPPPRFFLIPNMNSFEYPTKLYRSLGKELRSRIILVWHRWVLGWIQPPTHVFFIDTVHISLNYPLESFGLPREQIWLRTRQAWHKWVIGWFIFPPKLCCLNYD